ncbi:TA system VapC family ribonuclease toxin [Gemmatimonas sp.]|uniref:TA system VapC family ribonuclease toxin n=1 Tax=Gemmatimonas sp. TaxID=1962908 RepID=UPI0039831648
MAEGRSRVIVPDVTPLDYAVRAESAKHSTAQRSTAQHSTAQRDATRAWRDARLSVDEAVGLSWTVLTGFIRVGTNPRVTASPMRLDRATALVDEWLARRVTSVGEPGARQWPILRALLRDAGRGGNLTTVAHRAALCIARGATLHSADGALTRFRGLRYENPLRWPIERRRR